MTSFALSRCTFSWRTSAKLQICIRGRSDWNAENVWARMSAIEVERKFQVSPALRARLQSLSRSSTHTWFEDWYFSKELALKDIWLRKRSGTWELKVPSAFEYRKKLGTTVYREIVGPAIWEELAEENIEVDRVTPFAKIRTERTKMTSTRQSQMVEIVVDTCTSDDGFQYSVGEIEVLVESDSKVEDATKLLDQVAKSLDLNLDLEAPGKLITYLKHKDVPFYRQLEAKGLT